jgi:Leucine-rich repeat (LRR) protein
VVALNPFNFKIPHYLDDQMPKYLAEGPVIEKNIPHSWAQVHNKYNEMISMQTNQCILISAGTEATELYVLYLGGCKQITDVSSLQSCRVLKRLDLTDSSVTNAGMRGLELIPTLEELLLGSCKRVTDVSCLQSCRTLKKLVLARTNLTDAGIRGLELIHTLETLNLWGCGGVTDVSCLRNCRALKKLDLSQSSVTDVGIRGLELILTLEELDLSGCTKVHDLSALRNHPGLQIVAPRNTTLRL